MIDNQVIDVSRVEFLDDDVRQLEELINDT